MLTTHKHNIFGITSPLYVFLLLIGLVLLFYRNMSAPSVLTGEDFHFKYTVQKGFFAQSEEETDDAGFDFKTSNFGLINRTYPTTSKTGWPGLANYMDTLSRNAKKGESYKILFLARHGQGTHNVAEEKYGTRAWDCYYSALNGSDGLTWSDAPLTPLGITQAQAVNTLWKEELQNGIPVPQSWYISPLTRAIQTADTTFSDLGIAYEPLVKELLREALGIHTCDRRSTKSRIAESFPHVRFERGFTEDDELWQADYREPSSARDYRLATLLDEVFTMDAGEWISFTSHSGAIGSLLRVLGHRDFSLETGGVIPVFIKAEKVEGKRRIPPKEPSDSPPMCTEPPV